MKKLILTCALLTVATMVSFAQTTTTPTPSMAPTDAQARPTPAPMNAEQTADRRTKMDEKMLTLTPDQVKVVHDIELDFMNAVMKFRAEGKQPTPEQMQDLKTKKDQKMKAVLTADQYSKYDVASNRQRNAPMAPAPASQQQTGK